MTRPIAEIILCVLILILAVGLFGCESDPRAPNPLSKKQIERGLSEVIP